MYYVYVLDKSGQPLSPTTRYGKVRRMLKSGKAVPVKTKPFTIKLTYEPETHIVQNVTLGLDPGRTNIGLAAIDNSGRCLYSTHCTTRNKEIPKLMLERRQHRQAYRHGERLARKRLAKRLGTTMKAVMKRILPGYEKPITVKDIINTEARFNNRKRSSLWLTPTATQLLRTHLNLINHVCQILPVKRIVIELNKFAFMEMDNPNIKRWQYQKGAMYEYKSQMDALNELQNGVCLLCGKASIEHNHHIMPKSKGGSDTLTNRAGLCNKCHDMVHKDDAAAEKLAAKKTGLNKKYGALSVLNQIIPHLLDRLETKFPGEAYVTNGWNTMEFREAHGIVKNHDTDAYCIASSILTNQRIIETSIDSYEIKQFRRHNRANTHHRTQRTYYLDGKKIATNRKKAMEQKEDSLEDWLQKTIDSEGIASTNRKLSKLTVKKSQTYYNTLNRQLPGFKVKYRGKLLTITGQRTNGKYYLSPDLPGINIPAKETTLIQHNRGIVYI